MRQSRKLKGRRQATTAAIAVLALLSGACADIGTAVDGPQQVASIDDVRLVIVDRFDPMTLQEFGSVTSAAALAELSAIAAFGNDVFLIDNLGRRLLHVNLAAYSQRTVASLPDPASRGLYLDRDMTVFVTEPSNRRVRRFDRDGRELASLDTAFSGHVPSDVALTDWGRLIVVADRLENRLLMLHVLGGVYESFRPELAERPYLTSIAAIAASDDAVFVLDREGGELVRFNTDGRPTASFGADELIRPTAVAVDACGRLFVADAMPDRLYVSSEDMTMPAHRIPLPAVKASDVVDLWIDGSLLYALTSASEVAIFAIEPGCNR